MKIKRRVFEKDGQWYMGRTNSKGQEIACCCRDKAAAEQLLHLAESCYRKSVMFSLNKCICIGKVTNTGLLYENGENEPPTEVLFIRYEGSTYRRPLAYCKILGSEEKKNG